MPDDLERELAAFGQTLGAETSGPIRADDTVEPTTAAPQPARRWWAVVGAAAIVLAAFAGFVALNSGADDTQLPPVDSRDTTIPTPETTEAPSPTEPSTPESTPEPTVPTTTAAPPTDAVGPWTRDCVDELGDDAEEAPSDDEFTDAPFGPLAPEPGVRIVYPRPAMDSGGYSPPVSLITRVPQGTLIRVSSPTTETGAGQAQVIAVVDDDGTIRWRRCIPESYGFSSFVDAESGVAYMQMYPTSTNAEAWWAFDLTSGSSTVVDGAPDGFDNEPPPLAEVSFGGDQFPFLLRRVTADGSDVWRRDDLTDPGGEGFRVASSPPDGDGGPVLVRACVGPPSDGTPTTPDGQDCPYGLLGLDPDDGSTIWELDGNYGVSLVADGYAIVTDPDAAGRYDLLDLATGETVPDGVSDAPSAFLSECCGGSDYNRVENAGAIAWSVSTDWLDVWFPADRPGPGATIDLLGPGSTPALAATSTLVAGDGADSCAGEWCTAVRAVGTGFEPGATVLAQCSTQDESDTAWVDAGEPVELDVAADGVIAADRVCVVPAGPVVDQQLRVTIDGVVSNTVAG